MRITNKKDICAYVYKMYPYLFENHPGTIRRSLRAKRSMKRKHSNRSEFSIIKEKVFFLSFEKFGY